MPTTDIATSGVAFVVAGPGESDLLTVRALRLLQSADVVITDSEVVSLASEVANGEVLVALDSVGAPLSLASRTKALIDARKSGKAVARLLSGDPVIDGRLTMETAAVAKAGYAFEVAAGVSPLTAVPAHVGFSLTSGRTREVRIIDADSPTVDWTTHIDPTVTLVVHNAAERANEVAKALVKAGRDPQTPVAIIRDGATIEQRSLHSTLEALPSAMKLAKHSGAGLVIIGESAAERTPWFESRALHGWKITDCP